jgi:hypothetical protein
MRNVRIGRKGSGASWFEGVGGADWRRNKKVNTDKVIDLLSANLEPVNPGQFRRPLLLAMVTGVVAAFGLMLATVGPRPKLASTPHLEWSAAKLFFAFSIVFAGAPFLIKSMRPGRENETKRALLFFPLAATGALTLVMLLLGRDAWGTPLGAQAISPARCLFCIPFLAGVPLAALIWALRQGAPTLLRLSGAIAGIVAGGLGAAAYALACNSDTVPFIAIWYSGAIALCGIIGARLGLRFLTW